MLIPARSKTGGRIYRPDRAYRYQVIYIDSDGEAGVFGETNEADGGMPLACAKLMPWVMAARVIDKQSYTKFDVEGFMREAISGLMRASA